MNTGKGNHQIIYNAGNQTVSTVPVNSHGRPTVVTSCTYRIIDLRLSEEDAGREIVVAGTNATIDSTSTTSNADCGKGTSNAKRIPVAATTGFVQGKRYLITTADGIREMFLVEGIATNAPRYLYLRDELANKYLSGATVRGLEVSGTFPSTEANNEEKIQDGEGGPYAIDWTWDLDISPRREVIWIIRQPDNLLITEEDVLSIDNSFSATTGKRASIPTAIRQASSEIRAHLQLHQIDPDNFHSGMILKLCVAYRACWHLSRMLQGDANKEIATLYYTESQKYLDSICIGQAPEKSVKTSTSTDTAPPGSSKPYHHWQVIS